MATAEGHEAKVVIDIVEEIDEAEVETVIEIVVTTNHSNLRRQ